MTEDEIIRSYLMAPEFDRKRQIYRLVDLAQMDSFSICDLLRQHSITPPDVVFCDPAGENGKSKHKTPPETATSSRKSAASRLSELYKAAKAAYWRGERWTAIPSI